MASKKAKPIQQLFDEYTNKYRSNGAWEMAPTFAKKMADVLGAAKSALPLILQIEADMERSAVDDLVKNLNTAVQAFPNDAVLLYQAAQHDLQQKRFQNALEKLDASNTQFQQAQQQATDANAHLSLFKALPSQILALRYKIFIEMDKRDALTACPLFDLSAQTLSSFDVVALRRIQSVMIDYAVVKKNQGYDKIYNVLTM